MGHHAVRANDRPVTDCHAFENACSAANPDISPDLDFCDDERLAPDRRCSRQPMVRITNADVFANERIVADRNTGVRNDYAARIDPYPVAQRNDACFAGVEMYVETEPAMSAEPKLSCAAHGYRAVELSRNWYPASDL